MGAPESVHGGVEATRTNGSGADGGVMDKVKDAANKVT